MRLTIWDHPAAAFLVSGVDASPFSVDTEVEVRPQHECLRELLQGNTDVALIRTLEALEHADEVDVLPAVALSSWGYPFARLVLRNGLNQPPDRVAAAPDHKQENVIARLILKEHYGMMPEFVGSDGLPDRVVVSTGIGRHDDGLTLDLGQEWYELSGYPMLWGVFAVRKGEADDALIRRVRGIVKTSEDRKALWLQAQDQTPEMHDFFAEQLRVRFDDLAVAGLTEFRQHLFYMGVLDDVKELPVIFIPDNEDDDEGRNPLL